MPAGRLFFNRSNSLISDLHTSDPVTTSYAPRLELEHDAIIETLFEQGIYKEHYRSVRILTVTRTWQASCRRIMEKEQVFKLLLSSPGETLDVTSDPVTTS
nr:hypothetical protein [Tanacetum cinerariifolium]